MQSFSQKTLVKICTSCLVYFYGHLWVNNYSESVCSQLQLSGTLASSLGRSNFASRIVQDALQTWWYCHCHTVVNSSVKKYIFKHCLLSISTHNIEEVRFNCYQRLLVCLKQPKKCMFSYFFVYISGGSLTLKCLSLFVHLLKFISWLLLQHFHAPSLLFGEMMGQI